MATHRIYRCSEENGKAECELEKTKSSCEDKVTFITKDESCSCSEE